MAATTRPSSTLGKRSIVARLAALLALVACGVAIYFLVTSFTDDSNDGGSKNDKKGRSEQAQERKQASSAVSHTVAAGDTLSGIAQKTGIPEPRIARLNPNIDSETLNTGQVLALR